MSTTNKITVFPELNVLKRTLEEIQGTYTESKPQLAEALAPLKPKGKADLVDEFKPLAKNPLTKRTSTTLSKRMKALQEAMARVDADLADPKGLARMLQGEYDGELVENYGGVLNPGVDRIVKLSKELDAASYGTAALKLEHELKSEISLLSIGLNAFFEVMDLRPDIDTEDTILLDFVEELGKNLSGLGESAMLQDLWELVGSWITLFSNRSLYQDSLAYWLTVGEFELETPRNLDGYKKGDVLGRVNMKMGNIRSASMTRGRLPLGIELTTKGKLLVSNPDRLFAGTFRGLEMEIANDLGFKTNLPLGDLIFSEDLEATYSVRPPLKLTEAQEGMLLAYPTDPDGKLVGAQVTGGDFPPGIGFDTATGEFSVANVKRLKVGGYSLQVVTIDELGGETEHKITLVVEKGEKGIQFAFKSPGKFILPLKTGQSLGTVVASTGEVVGMALLQGLIPKGIRLMPDGRVTVIASRSLQPGDYEFQVSVTTSTKQTGTLTIKLSFEKGK